MTNVYYASNVVNNINEISYSIDKQKLAHKFELMKKNQCFLKQDYVNIYKLLIYKTDGIPTITPTSIIFNINRINDCTLKLISELMDFCKKNKIEKRSSGLLHHDINTIKMDKPIKLIIKKNPVKLRILTTKSQDLSLENRINIPNINKLRSNTFSAFFTENMDEINGIIPLEKNIRKTHNNKKKELSIRQLLNNKKKELKKNHEGTRHVYVSVTQPCNDMSENYYKNNGPVKIEDEEETLIEDEDALIESEEETSIEDEKLLIESEEETSIEDEKLLIESDEETSIEDDMSIESEEDGYSVEKIKHIIKKN